MQIDRAVGPEGGHPSEKLDGLQFAAEFQLHEIVNRHVIYRGKRQRLQRGIVQVRIRGRKTTDRDRHRGPGTVR